jgi:hypothetical protein
MRSIIGVDLRLGPPSLAAGTSTVSFAPRDEERVKGVHTRGVEKAEPVDTPER